MCDPTGGLLTVGMMAMGAGSSIFSGITKSNQDNYQAQLATQNAGLAQRSADIATQQGVDQQSQLYRKVGQTMGSQTAGFAAAGLDPTFGSAASTIEGTAAMGEEDAQRQRDNTMNTVNSYMLQKTGDLATASADKTAGRNDLFSGVLGAASSIIGGASQLSKFSASSGAGATGGMSSSQLSAAGVSI